MRLPLVLSVAVLMLAGCDSTPASQPKTGQAAAAPAALAGFLTAPGRGFAQPPAPKGDPLKITDVKTILTAPANIRLVVVKVVTSEPGLYGLGCATFTQRAIAPGRLSIMPL